MFCLIITVSVFCPVFEVEATSSAPYMDTRIQFPISNFWEPLKFSFCHVVDHNRDILPLGTLTSRYFSKRIRRTGNSVMSLISILASVCMENEAFILESGQWKLYWAKGNQAQLKTTPRPQTDSKLETDSNPLNSLKEWAIHLKICWYNVSLVEISNTTSELVRGWKQYTGSFLGLDVVVFMWVILVFQSTLCTQAHLIMLPSVFSQIVEPKYWM